MTSFKDGFKAMLPITTGIIPFALVMGTISSEAQLSLMQTIGMNIFVFAGASQLASIDLMLKNTEVLIILVTGLMINMRFMLYSAAMSPTLKDSKLLTKLSAAYLLTDQNYAVMSANQDHLKSSTETIKFFFGSSLCMILTWNTGVILGFVFGNFAPTSWALDYAVPLSFVALVIPSLKNNKYVMVAGFSSISSIVLTNLPFNLGLICTAVLAISLGAYLTKKKRAL